MRHHLPLLTLIYLLLVGCSNYNPQQVDGLENQLEDESKELLEPQRIEDSLRLAAEQGDAQAQFNFGFRYYSGKGVAEDHAEAAKWSRLAAEQGHALAQYSLGFMYYNGEGVTEDYVEAAKWYRLAAEQGNASAQVDLGYMYANGEGVTADDAEAVKWFRLAAEQGHASAEYNLGFMHAKKLKKDLREALLIRQSTKG